MNSTTILFNNSSIFAQHFLITTWEKTTELFVVLTPSNAGALFVSSFLKIVCNEVLGMPNLFDTLFKENSFSADGGGKQLKTAEWTSDLLSSQVLLYMQSIFLANLSVSWMVVTICASNSFPLPAITNPAIALTSFILLCLIACYKANTSCCSNVCELLNTASTIAFTALDSALDATFCDLGPYFFELLKESLLILTLVVVVAVVM